MKTCTCHFSFFQYCKDLVIVVVYINYWLILDLIRRGTPVRLRSDIRSQRKLKQVNVGGGSEPPVSHLFVKYFTLYNV